MIKYSLISDVVSGVGGVETLEIGAWGLNQVEKNSNHGLEGGDI